MGSKHCRRMREHVGAVLGWPVWRLRPWLAAFIGLITAAYVIAIVVAVAVHPWPGSWRNLWLCGALLLCTALTVEVTKRTGENAGVIKDVYTVWELPLAILLPPVYALVAPIFRFTLTQLRIRRIPLHRRVFSTAVVGLSNASASLVFHALTGQGFGMPTSPGPHAASWLAAVVVAALALWTLNTSLVFVAIRGSDPTVRLRDLYLARESVQNDVTELCVAVLVTLGIAVTPLTIFLSFP